MVKFKDKNLKSNQKAFPKNAGLVKNISLNIPQKNENIRKIKQVSLLLIFFHYKI